MLRANFKFNNNLYHSWKIEDYKFILENKKNFTCPYCQEEVIFVDGIEVIKHFRHKKESSCDFEPESQEHLEMKKFMKDFLNLSDEDIEVNLGFARPDLFIKESSLVKNRDIAIEVQCSKITKKKFLERCDNYTKNNIAVLWIFHDKLLELGEEEQNIPSLLKAAQDNCFGRVYIYSNKEIFSVRFRPTFRWVDEYTDYKSGETFGGYLKKYKRKKVIEIIQTIPDKDYDKQIIKARTKWKNDIPSGYFIAKFLDI